MRYIVLLALALLCSIWSVKAATLEEQLHDEVAAASGSSEVYLSGYRFYLPHMPHQPLTRPDAFTSEVVITALDIDRINGRFEGELSPEAGDVIRFTGRYESMIPMPVLNQQVQKGQLIDDAMIDMQSVRAHQVRRHNLVNPAAISGQLAERPIQPGELLSKRDIRQKMLVKEGQLVSLVYRTAHIHIRAVGEAQSDGASGQIIEAENVDSEQKVRAMVLDSGELLVNYGDYIRSQVAMNENSIR